jgi:hypothetical protein
LLFYWLPKTLLFATNHTESSLVRCFAKIELVNELLRSGSDKARLKGRCSDSPRGEILLIGTPKGLFKVD